MALATKSGGLRLLPIRHDLQVGQLFRQTIFLGSREDYNRVLQYMLIRPGRGSIHNPHNVPRAPD